MNFVISDVDDRRRQDYPDPTSPEVANRFLSVSKYNDLARCIIGKWAPPHIKMKMLTSEDAISYVSYYIMMGDWGWGPDKGTKINTYRCFCGKRAIKSWIGLIKNQGRVVVKKKAGDETIRISQLDDQSRHDERLPDPFLESIENENGGKRRKFLSKLIDELKDTQRACIVMYFVHGEKKSEIAHKLGLSPEGVRRSIASGLVKMRKIAKRKMMI